MCFFHPEKTLAPETGAWAGIEKLERRGEALLALNHRISQWLEKLREGK